MLALYYLYFTAGEVVSNHDELMSNFFAQPDALAYGMSTLPMNKELNEVCIVILLLPPSLEKFTVSKMILINRSSWSLSATYCQRWTSFVAFCSKFLIHSYSGRNRMELNFPCKNGFEARSSAASNGPKEIFSHGLSIKKPSLDINYASIDDVISSEAVFTKQSSIASSTKMSSNSNSRANTCRETKSSTFLGNPIINFTNSSTGFNPCSAGFYIYVLSISFRRDRSQQMVHLRRTKDLHSRDLHFEP